MPAARGRADGVRVVALGLALAAVTVAFGLQKIRSFDYWWMLRTGRLIAETGEVPTHDPYTYTVEGARWIDIHWLHQLGLHGLYSLDGHRAVVLAKAGLGLLLVALLGTIGWRRERPAVTALGLALMLVVVADRMMPRPELTSFVLLAASLAILDRFERRGDGWVYLLVGVQLVWVNVHGLFALGLALVAIHAVAEALRPALAPGGALRPERLRRLAAALALSSGACLLNPNGLDGLVYPLQQLAMVGPPEERGIFGSLIAELTPPLGAERSPSLVTLSPAILLAALSFAAGALNWRHLRAADPLLWVAFGYLALGAQRNVALFAIVASTLFVRNTQELLDRRAARAPRARRAAEWALAALLAALAVDVARGDFHPRMGSMREPGLGTLDFYYPVDAFEWIARERPPGPIAHHMADGGYLLWRLWPDYRSMVDGRLEVFGSERFVHLQLADSEHFRALDEEFGFGTVVIHFGLVASDELLRWLHLNPSWRFVHVDDVAAVFVRADAAMRERWPEVDLDAPDLFGPLAARRGVEDQLRRSSRVRLLMALGRNERALASWEETLELYPDLPQGPVVRAALLQRTGFPAAAEAIFRDLLREAPDDPRLLAQVGDLRLEAQDVAAARELYARAMRADRDLPYVIFRNAQMAELAGDEAGAALLYGRVAGLAHPADPLSIRARARFEALGGSLQLE